MTSGSFTISGRVAERLMAPVLKTGVAVKTRYRRFESYPLHQRPRSIVANASACRAENRGFESHRGRQRGYGPKVRTTGFRPVNLGSIPGSPTNRIYGGSDALPKRGSRNKPKG